MNGHGGRIRVVLAAVLVGILTPGAASAQAWNYPAFQPPTITVREFNFGIADGGDAGTSLVFQWREGVGTRTQIGFDAGFADADGGFTPVLLGGHLAYQMMRASADMPLDLLFTGGVYAALEDDNVFRIPIGVVLGHRFPLEGRLAITPYVHPRVMIDFCDVCFGADDSDLGVGFDLGGSFEFSPRLTMRLAFSLGGTDLFEDDNSFGLSLAWMPGRR